MAQKEKSNRVVGLIKEAHTVQNVTLGYLLKFT